MAKTFGTLEFIEFLSRIIDRCRAQGKNWKLEKLLFTTILARLSGATSYRKVDHLLSVFAADEALILGHLQSMTRAMRFFASARDHFPPPGYDTGWAGR